MKATDQTRHDKIALAIVGSAYEPALLVKVCFASDSAKFESAQDLVAAFPSRRIQTGRAAELKSRTVASAATGRLAPDSLPDLMEEETQ